ncbi:MAG TPA: putative lipid II flippase FtsW [Coriobacteriia bacterium]|nr:putative lipid II flippase FtsW [Coriobacteriia bacterium]
MAGQKRQFAGGSIPRYLFMGSALFLTCFGVVMIYSASSIKALAADGTSIAFVRSQILFAVIAWTIALVLSRFDYRRFKETHMLWWSGAVGLLVIVLGIGVVSHGARRWIPLGFINLQPSELAKIACVIAVAAVAVDWQRGRLSTKDFLIRAMWLTAIPAALIMMQPDMGTTATLIVAVVIVLILAGVSLTWVFGSAATLVALGVVFVASSAYRMRRVAGFLDPWKDQSGNGYQIVQALYAFGSGGVKGVGLGLSRQKFFYLPEAHTDFILAIIGEEVGLIGTLAIVVAFGVFAYAGLRIAAGAKDSFGKLLAGGMTGMLAFQAAINMAAVTGLMPVTGKPLPFVSYGGASMLVTMIAVGLVLSVSEYGTLAPRAVKGPRPVEERQRESGHERRRDSRARVSGTERRGQTRRRA